MNLVYIVKGNEAYQTTKKLVEKIDFRLKNKKVLVKPNLTTSAPAQSGITTDVNVVRAILERLENCEIVIGEGSVRDTIGAFKANAYLELANEFKAKLVDLNRDIVITQKIPKPFQFKELPFAKTALECDYLINVAKLKTHSLATVSLCLKNLFGAIVPRRSRVIIHPFINRAICDFVQILRSDFNVIDGIVGNQKDEVVSNPVSSGVIIGGYDALSVDLVASKCMGIDPEEVEHLRLAQVLLGKRDVKVIGEKIEDAKVIYERESLLTTKLRYMTERILSYLYKVT